VATRIGFWGPQQLGFPMVCSLTLLLPRTAHVQLDWWLLRCTRNSTSVQGNGC